MHSASGHGAAAAVRPVSGHNQSGNMSSQKHTCSLKRVNMCHRQKERVSICRLSAIFAVSEFSENGILHHPHPETTSKEEGSDLSRQ